MWTQKNEIKNVLDRETEIRSNFQHKDLWRRLLIVMRPAKENQRPPLIWLRKLLWLTIWEVLIHVTSPHPHPPPFPNLEITEDLMIQIKTRASQAQVMSVECKFTFWQELVPRYRRPVRLCLRNKILRSAIACSRLRDGGGSRSVIRNAKNARGLGRDRPPPPFPSRARLIFALLVLIRSHYTIWEPGTG